MITPKPFHPLWRLFKQTAQRKPDALAENTDNILLEQLSKGSREAFRALYDAHVRTAYAVALRITGNYEDAEEASQDAFLELARLGAKARAIRSARAWLIQVSTRRSIDLLRKRSRRDGQHRADGVVAIDPLERATESPLGDIVNSDMAARIRVLSARLPERQQAAFALRHYQGMSIAEVAEAMQCSEGAIKAHLHFAIRRLRELLRAEGALGEAQPNRVREEGT